MVLVESVDQKKGLNHAIRQPRAGRNPHFGSGGFSAVTPAQKPPGLFSLKLKLSISAVHTDVFYSGTPMFYRTYRDDFFSGDSQNSGFIVRFIDLFFHQ